MFHFVNTDQRPRVFSGLGGGLVELALFPVQGSRRSFWGSPGTSAFHSFSTVPGLWGPAEAGTLTWLRLGAQLLHAVHGSCLLH